MKTDFRFILASLTMISLFMFTSCRTFKAVAPPEAYETPTIVLKESVISVPIEIDMKDVESRINKELTGTLYDDNSFDNNNTDNLKVKAIKKEDFTFGLTGNELTYRIPLKLQIQIKQMFVVLPVINAEIALKFKTIFSLNKDWTLMTKTTSNGYEWLSTPSVNVKGYDISIKYVADIIMSAARDKFTKEIDKAVKENINLKDYVTEAWEMLQKPIKVSDEYNAWLKITPSEIISTQIIGRNEKVNLGIGIKSVNEVYVGSEPAKSNPGKVPNLTLVAKIDPRFAINLNTDLQISKVNELAEKELVGQVFKDGKRAVTITNIKVYGSNNFFIVEVGLVGSIKGKVYLRGRPEYNPANRSIEIKDVDFDINTKNALVKSASWLIHGKLIKMIQPALVYSIAKDLDDMKKQIQENLKANRSVKGVLIKGDLKKIDIDKIYITPQSIKVSVFLDGILTVIIENLKDM